MRKLRRKKYVIYSVFGRVYQWRFGTFGYKSSVFLFRRLASSQVTQISQQPSHIVHALNFVFLWIYDFLHALFRGGFLLRSSHRPMPNHLILLSRSMSSILATPTIYHISHISFLISHISFLRRSLNETSNLYRNVFTSY